MHVHMNLAELAILQNEAELADTHLDQAEALAKELNYSEALGDIAQLRGDILLTSGDASAAQVSFHYSEALVHAADFNQTELDKRLNYLAELLRAMAEDGDVQGASSICENIVFLWKEADLDEPFPQVLEFLINLRAGLEPT